MRIELNPYTPGSGLQPTVMSGRMGEIEAFDRLVAVSKAGRIGRSLVLHGLRGVGKTVLLNYFRNHAEDKGWFTVAIEGTAETKGTERFLRQLARELTKAGRRHGQKFSGNRFSQALKTIDSFNVSIGATGVELSVGLGNDRANSGDPDIDLEELVEDLSVALRENHTAFGLFIDEMQEVPSEILSILLSLQHKAGQNGWPFYLVGAGLPNLPVVLSEARSYAERLFDYRHIGSLTDEDAEFAIRRPAKKMGAEFDTDAMVLLLEASGRYPYFIQEFGSEVWSVAPSSPFTYEDAQIAVEMGKKQLDAGFFNARWGRATKAERQYLKAMAEDGGNDSSTRDVSERLGVPLRSLGTARASLIGKGIIYAPEHGYVAFTVPGMADFIRRQDEENATD